MWMCRCHHGRQAVESAHPHRDKGGLQVEKLVLPPSVTIRSITPLPVVVQEQVTIGGAAPLTIEGAVSVTADDPLAVLADKFVDNKVTIGGKV